MNPYVCFGAVLCYHGRGQILPAQRALVRGILVGVFTRSPAVCGGVSSQGSTSVLAVDLSKKLFSSTV